MSTLLLKARMLALPYVAARPLCHCWRASRSWPAAAHLRSAAVSSRLFRSTPHAPLQSRLPWSARERACSSGGCRTFGVPSAAGACVLRRLCTPPWSERTLPPPHRAGVGHSGVTQGAVGSLHLIIGPMFAGKTTALLQIVQEHEARRAPCSHRPHAGWLQSSHWRSPQGNGKNVVVVKSDRDGRYSTREVVSHDGLRRVRQRGVVAAVPP